MSTQPLQNLELQALQQRNQLHVRATELKQKITTAREKLDLERNAREHFTGFAIAAGTLGLLSGYVAAGLFIDK